VNAKREPAPCARTVAQRVLMRVNSDGAWAGPTLDAELGRAQLDARDAALATEIVYGSLRCLQKLDASLQPFIKHPHKVQPIARAALRVAAYQILHLERVPPHAAVNAAVTSVRQALGPHVGGFVNAVLRKVAALRPAEPQRPQSLALPAWLAEALTQSLGSERSERFIASRPLPPPLGVRLTRPELRDDVISAIQTTRAHAQVDIVSDPVAGLRVQSGGNPRRWAGYDDGHFVVQELGSQLVGLSAPVKAGDRVLDVCAGRGGKTMQFMQWIGERGEVVACDLYEGKLNQLMDTAGRLGFADDRLQTEAIDFTVGVGGLSADFDVVFVDAPCTGVGTLHRRPEMLLRLKPEDPARMAEIQKAILSHAADLVRPGGLLIYAVCSPLHEEGAAVFDTVLSNKKHLSKIRTLRGEIAGDDPDAEAWMIGPWLGDFDAYQVFTGKAV